MATHVAIAQMRDLALQRLTTSMTEISKAVGVEAAALPDFNRDRDYLHAQQLTALAEWAEGVALALTTQAQVERNTHGNLSHEKASASRRQR